MEGRGICRFVPCRNLTRGGTPDPSQSSMLPDKARSITHLWRLRGILARRMCWLSTFSINIGTVGKPPGALGPVGVGDTRTFGSLTESSVLNAASDNSRLVPHPASAEALSSAA